MYKLTCKSPHYVMMSSDYSQQEPKLTAFIASPRMCEAYKQGKDIYAEVASVSFGVPYEKCLEFHPETHEYQPDGKQRRTEAKSILLGINYGRSVKTIGEQLYGSRDDMTDDEKTKAAQHVYDSVMNAFPDLKGSIAKFQYQCSKLGYTETILGRRRHIPDMTLPKYEFVPMKHYVNPNVDPLDPSTLAEVGKIPASKIKALTYEFSQFKYRGQVFKRTKQLAEQEHIQVIDNTRRITDASRQVFNCVDANTQILTKSGWKNYNEIYKGDEILSLNINTGRIVDDRIENVFVYPETQSVTHFKTQTFDAVSTPGHNWVTKLHNKLQFVTTEKICSHIWPDYPLVTIAPNDFNSNVDWSDDALKLLGWSLTDGNLTDTYYNGAHERSMTLYQSTHKAKNKYVYQDMIQTLNKLNLRYTDRENEGYHTIHVLKSDLVYGIIDTYAKTKHLSFEFVSTLSQHQCSVLLQAMLQADGSGVDGKGKFLSKRSIEMACSTSQESDIFQYLAVRAGYMTHSKVITARDCPSNHKYYSNLGLQGNIIQKKNLYIVSIYRPHLIQIYQNKRYDEVVNLTWCVQTSQHTWIARRNGYVYITGNSRIQGSAAEETKMALLKLHRNERWHEIGGRLLDVVHDECIAEVPGQYAEEGGKILSGCMVDAANFLPFPSKCDVETTYRWYGESVDDISAFDKPDNIEDKDALTESNIKWIQIRLAEMEYLLPVFKDENGEKPNGIAAHGINGIQTDDMWDDVDDYIKTRGITKDQFVDTIDKEVIRGIR